MLHAVQVPYFPSAYFSTCPSVVVSTGVPGVITLIKHAYVCRVCEYQLAAARRCPVRSITQMTRYHAIFGAHLLHIRYSRLCYDEPSSSTVDTLPRTVKTALSSHIGQIIRGSARGGSGYCHSPAS